MKNQSLTYLLISLAIMSCGGDRNVDQKSSAQTINIPEDQVSYREARKTFSEWISVFSTHDKIENGFNLITSYSKKVLAQKYSVHTADQFSGWFTTLSISENAPFNFYISRIDIQDIFITDSLATITAAYQLRERDKTSDEIGSFFLRKKNKIWFVPFAESSDWITSWWERGMSVKALKVEDGFTSYRSNVLGVQISYPQAWDIAYPKLFYMPHLSHAINGIELSYTPENESQPQIYFRMSTLNEQVNFPYFHEDMNHFGGFTIFFDPSAEVLQERSY